MNKKNSGFSLLMPVFFVLAVALGMLISNYFNSKSPQKNIFDFSLANNKINAIIDMLDEDYVEKIEKEELIEQTIPTLLEELDPHTIYIPARDFIRANEELEGNFGGIGIQFLNFEDTVAVIRTIEFGPSEKAGIIAGDRIVKVNDSIIAGVRMSTQGIISLLKGKIGTLVEVTVRRKGKKEPFPVTIQRGLIPIYSVEIAYMLNRKTAYIYVSRFARNTYHEFMRALDQLQKEGMEQLIVDLRGNTGGYMDAAVAMINEFLPKDQLIVYTQGKSSPRFNRYANGRGQFQQLPLAILIDESSASASEIFAGAVQDNDRGIIVGRRSFGKGLVQEQREFPDGSALRLTVSHYYTPTGRSIQKPYDRKNKIEYYHDIQNRYNNGEFQQVDSTLFIDSLKKITPKGKVVYGGGGIMPDVFVSLDTSEFTNYYSLLSDKNIIQNFAFYYADKNRNKMLELIDHSSIEKFLDKHGFMNDFFAYSTKRGIPKDPVAYPVSKNLIQNQIKALIANYLIDNEGLYPILHKRDKVLKRAVEEMSMKN